MKANVSTSSNEDSIRETENDPVVTQQQLTTYEDAEANESVQLEDNASFLWRASHPLPDQGLQEVLSRSYKIAEFVWAENDAPESTIATLSFPKALWDIAQVKNKLDWFGLFRCKGVKISVRINSTAFHYGAIAMSHVTGVGDGSDDPLFGVDYGLHSRTFHQRMNNHVLILKAMTGESIEQEIPWELPVQWLDIHRNSSLGRDAIIGKVWFDAMTSLHAVATSIQPVNVSVFANFVSPQVSAPLATPQAWDPVPPPPVTQSAEEKEKTSLLTEVTDGVSSVVSSFQSMVNMAAPIAKTAMLLLDKPGTIQSPTIVENRAGMNTYYGYGTSQYPRMSLHPDAKTDVDGSLSTVGLKPTIREMISVPGYWGTFSFDNTTAVGTELSSYRVNPAEWFLTGTSYNPTYLSYVAQMFYYWRGSIDYHFHFITSKFVTSRVRISFKPMANYRSDVPAYPPDGPGGDVISKVIDISGDTHVSIRVPFVSETLFKRVAGIRDLPELKGNLKYSTGGLTVTLVNEIASQSTGQSVFCFVWISGGPDMQFNQFVGQKERLYLDVEPSTIPQAQAAVRKFPELVEPIIDSTGCEVVAIADSEHFDDYVSLGKRFSIIYPDPPSSTLSALPVLYPGPGVQSVELCTYLAAPYRWIRGGGRLRAVLQGTYASRLWELRANNFQRYTEAGAIATDTGIELPYYEQTQFVRALSQGSYTAELLLRERLTGVAGLGWFRAFSDDVGFSGLYSPPAIKFSEPAPPPPLSSLEKKKLAS